MVDQNSSPQEPPSEHKPEETHAASNSMSSPSVVKAGEMMLIFAMVLIFFVCLSVAVHLYLRRKRRRRRPKSKNTKKPKTKKKGEALQPELQSQERKVAELIGTPLCEMGDSEPRHEMEDVEVHERHTTVNIANPADNPVVSPVDPDLEAGTLYFGDMTVSPVVQPDAGIHAVYFARGM